MGVQAADETHIVVTDVDIHETTQRAGIVKNPRPDTRMVVLQGIQDFGQGAAVGAHLTHAAGIRAQDGRDGDGGTPELVAYQNSLTAS